VWAGALVATASAAAPVFTTTGHSLSYTGSVDVGGIAVGPDGALWITEPEQPAFARVDITDGTIEEFEPENVDWPQEPQSIVAGSDGGLWFTEPSEDAIGRLDPVTREVELFDSANTDLSDGSSPLEIVSGPDENLWFTELNNHAIGKLEPAHGETAVQITEYSAGISGGTSAITAGPEPGMLWFTERGEGGRIARISTTGAVGPTFEHVLSNPAVAAPSSITAGPDDNLWFTGGFAGGHVSRITPSGSVTKFTSNIHEASTETQPIVGPDGNLYSVVSDFGELLKITPAGAVTAYVPPESAGLFSDLTGPMVLGPDGELWEVSQFGEVIHIDVESGDEEPGPDPGPDPGPGSVGGGDAAGSGGSSPAPSPAAPAPATSSPKPIKCKKGFVKRTVRGKARCVKKKHKPKKRHKH
jgi:virginiamycin B lyase